MSVIVDGFNLLRGAQRWAPVGALGQLHLCQLLGQWSALTGEAVTIVFDGPLPRSGYAEQLRRVGVEVVHSGSGRTADDLIIEAIGLNSAPRSLQVVSSDREIRQAARRRGAQDWDSQTFFYRMWRELKATDHPAPTETEPTEKRHGLDEAETQRWLQEFQIDPDDLEPDDLI